jgi:glutamyl-tRNA synthetase
MQRLKTLVPELPNGGELAAKIGTEGWGKLERALPGLKERAKTVVEILDNAEYLFAKRPIALDAQAEKLLDEAGRKVLGALLPRLESVEPWTPDALDAVVRSYAEEAGLKLGKVAQPLRAALTGRTTSPGIFDVLEVLGREESLARIRDKVLHSKSA